MELISHKSSWSFIIFKMFNLYIFYLYKTFIFNTCCTRHFRGKKANWRSIHNVTALGVTLYDQPLNVFFVCSPRIKTQQWSPNALVLTSHPIEHLFFHHWRIVYCNRNFFAYFCRILLQFSLLKSNMVENQNIYTHTGNWYFCMNTCLWLWKGS